MVRFIGVAVTSAYIECHLTIFSAIHTLFIIYHIMYHIISAVSPVCLSACSFGITEEEVRQRLQDEAAARTAAAATATVAAATVAKGGAPPPPPAAAPGSGAAAAPGGPLSPTSTARPLAGAKGLPHNQQQQQQQQQKQQSHQQQQQQQAAQSPEVCYDPIALVFSGKAAGSNPELVPLPREMHFVTPHFLADSIVAKRRWVA